MRRLVIPIAVLLSTALVAVPTAAQTKAEDKPKTLWQEIGLFAYIENSYVWNLGHTGRGDVNELRLYDFDAGWTFNAAEFSLKKEPSERYPFGFGVVATAGLDSQKNHAVGIFRDGDDVFPFRNTSKYDVLEAYASYKLPLGSGLTVKAGKFVTLLGYEVIESPNNLNFSRSFNFVFAIPLTHVGMLFSYAPTDWLSLTAGPVVGWDVAEDNNDRMSVLGQVALTPVKDLAVNLNWITGPEQNKQGTNRRTVLDLTATYTGIPGLTLGLNVDYGREEDEVSLAGSGTRRDNDARWWGYAGYVAYDWTDRVRTAVRGEYFQDPEGVRTLATAAGAGGKVSLWETTATIQYRIWKGLVGRLEYRHDEDTSEKVFKVRAPGLIPTSRYQDTITVALHYVFF
jgi:hypothetical protein